MPNVFVLDRKGGREWQDILPHGRTFCSYDPVNGLSCEGITAGDVLVFHEESGAVRKAVETLGRTGVWVVAVNEGGGDGKEVSHGFYRRRRGVQKPADTHFKACFAYFLRRLMETGNPDWHLLEGPPPPDALLAYHLLDLLRGDEAADRAREGLVDAARKEAQTIAATTGTAPLAAIDDPAQRREFLKRCS